MLLLVCSGISAQDTVRLTLDSCLRYAYGHNLQVRTAVLNQESSEVGLTGAKLRFLPSVSASASQGWNWGGQSTSAMQYGINGSLTLFSGLSNLRNLQQSRSLSEQNALKVQQAENSVAAQVVQAYLTMLMNEERLTYQQEVLETSRQQKLEGEVKYQVGRILESDYMLLEANYTSAQAEIDNTRLTIEENRSSLLTLLGMEPSVRLEVVPSSDSLRAVDRQVIPFDSLLAQAMRTMPDWQISQLEVESARLSVGLAQSAFLPTVSLGANLGGQWIPDDGNGSESINNSSISLGVSIPLLNRGISYTQLKQSKIALREAELQNNQTLIDLENDLQQLHLTACQALNRYRATEALAEAYHASYEVYVLKYGEGAVTTVEMLQQQSNYLSALNDYLQNKYTFLLSEKQLDIYTGKNIAL